MKKRNWKHVFVFTVEQAVKGKNFMAISIGVALLLFFGLFGINVGVASLGNKDDDAKEIQKVYYSATADLPQFTEEDFAVIREETGITYVPMESEEPDLSLIQTEEENAIIVMGSVEEDGAWKLQILYSEESNVDEGMCEEFFENCQIYIEQIKKTTLQLSPQQLAFISTPAAYEIFEAGGNERNVGETLFKMFAPMIICFIMYMMLIIYGQSITKVVIAEKSSKLMETLLISVQPYDIIAGKIIGMVCVALVQMFVWVSCGVGGFFLGDKVARGISDSYHNVLIDIGKVIQEGSKGAFSAGTILCAVISFCLGFVFFSVIAGWTASRLEKVEDLSGATTMFQMPVIISFMVAYLIPLQENAAMSAVIRYIPFTAAFCLPSDFLIGNTGMAEGIIALLILLIASLVMIYVTGKSYKKNVF